MTDVLSPLTFARGPAMKNRFALAPLTNCQSHADGTLSAVEEHWLDMRAGTGFGMTMTCAAHVVPSGQTFPGQLAIFDDRFVDGLSRLARRINGHGSVSIVQLHHGGKRCPAALVGQPVAPSDDSAAGARALTLAEIEEVIEGFGAAAARAERAGFHGVEVHGAHGYLIAQFLSASANERTDRYGGSLENRARLLLEVLRSIRARTGPDFMLGVRLSPERFGMRLEEIRDLATEVMRGGGIDFLDASLWDYAKAPIEEGFGGSLIQLFADLPRGDVRMCCAGSILTGADVRKAMEAGMDFVMLGKAAMLHHDFVQRYIGDPNFASRTPPVSEALLRAEGMSDPFLDYLRGFPNSIVAAV